MSREIKFRMFDSLEKQFMYDSRVLESRISDLNKNERWLYQQWTGLFDKNGKEIYEGDILKCKRTKTAYKDGFDWTGDIETFFKNSVIEWWESFSNIGYRLRDGKGKTMMVKPSSLSKMEVEVIGNIFENAHLLEDGHEKASLQEN